MELLPLEKRKVGAAVRDKLLALTTGVAPDPHRWFEQPLTGSG